MSTLTREYVAKWLGLYYTRKLGGKVWSSFDTSKRAYEIRGEGLPAHPDMKAQYPNGWAMLDWVKPTEARRLVQEFLSTDSMEGLEI